MERGHKGGDVMHHRVIKLKNLSFEGLKTVFRNYLLWNVMNYALGARLPNPIPRI